MRLHATGSPTQPLCPLCGEAAARVRHDYGPVKIVECDKCGLWRTCPRPSAQELTEHYESHYYSPELERAKYQTWREANQAVWRASAAEVARAAGARGIAPEGLTLLDVGCGQGYFLEYCRELGMAARGIEPGRHAVRYATEQLHLDVRQLDLGDVPGDEQYDVITLWQVLEHVDNPLATMRQVLAHLRPGGQAWVATPNAGSLGAILRGWRWFNFQERSHLTHFHARTLRRLLEAAGFSDVRRHVQWGGGQRRGLGLLPQYLMRRLGLGTEVRFVVRKPL